MPLLSPDPASEDAWVTTAMDQNASLIASRMASDIAHDNLLTAYGGHLPTINVNVSRNWALEHGNFEQCQVAARPGGADRIDQRRADRGEHQRRVLVGRHLGAAVHRRR